MDIKAGDKVRALVDYSGLRKGEVYVVKEVDCGDVYVFDSFSAGGFDLLHTSECELVTDTPAASPISNITLRDWFAGQALAGMLASTEHDTCSEKNNDNERLWLARDAYRQADAMIAQREVPND